MNKQKTGRGQRLPRPDKKIIRLRLRMALFNKGYQSLKQWCDGYKFNLDTAITAIDTWGGTDLIPHGGVSREIIARLNHDIGTDWLYKQI